MAKIQDIRNRTQRTNGTRKLSQIKYIVRHHSATTTGNFDSFWNHWHGTLGWGTGGYHEIILRDGTVQLCYNPNEITNGVGNYNTPTYHICLVGNGSFTTAQEKAWDERVAYNMKRLSIGVNNVKGHKEMPGASTSCPGINMDTVRSRIKGGTSTSKPKTTSTKAAKSSGNLGLVDWMKAQKIDSSFSNRKKLAGKHGIKNYKGTASQNTQLLNKLKGSNGKSAGTSSSSGSLPNTRYWVKSPASSRFNGSGVRKVQEALASVYYYPNKGAKNNGVDGWYGPDTADAVKRFQSMHGLEDDGIYGPDTRSKLMEVSPLY